MLQTFGNQAYGDAAMVTERVRQPQLQVLADRMGEGIDPAPRNIRDWAEANLQRFVYEWRV